MSLRQSSRRRFLKSGQEWHSESIQLQAGSVVKLICRGTSRFYAGFFSEGEYVNLRRKSPGLFPFQFGEDRIEYIRTLAIVQDGLYRVVFRIGIFTPPGNISVRLEVVKPPAAEPKVRESNYRQELGRGLRAG